MLLVVYSEGDLLGAVFETAPASVYFFPFIIFRIPSALHTSRCL